MRSRSEITGLVMKAARGAGLPLGLCEDLAAAAAYLDARDLGALCDMLGCEAELLALVGDLDALECGRPGGDTGPRWLRDALAAARGICAGTGAALAAPVPARGPEKVPDGMWQRLEVLAARTFVPATAASRLAGAGAGLSDND